MSGFVPVGAVVSDVVVNIDSRRKKLVRTVSITDPLMGQLREVNALLDAQRDREERRAKGRQLIAQGALMLREVDGATGADEWLIQNMSATR